MLSLSTTGSLHFSESQNLNNKNPIHSCKILQCPNGSLRFSRTENLVLNKISRFIVKSSGGNEIDAKPSLQSSKNITGGSSPANSFLSVLCPLLKFFAGGDPSQERNDVFEVTTSSLSSLARLPWGSKSMILMESNPDSAASQPQLQLYEFEACPFCRRVREAMTELDLSAEVYPCPKGSLRHRAIVQKIGEKSSDIVEYLFQNYGEGRKPSFGLLESTLFTGWVPTIVRAGRGMTLWDKAQREPPPKKLELFSYENNPYARIVREALCELELPYILHNVGEGSQKVEMLFRYSGSRQVPYLIDPNTGTHMGDYKKILLYLFQSYSASN